LEKNMTLLKHIKSMPRPQDRPLIIAITGFGGSGKSTLAEKLRRQLNNAQVVSIDDFILERNAGRSVDWDSFDRDRLRQQVLAPAMDGRGFNYQVYDWKEDKLGKRRTVPKCDYLIVEGISVFHPGLCDYYDFKIWVDCPLNIATARAVQRDRQWGNDHDELWRTVWSPNDRGYFHKYRPDLAADIKVATL
jgi:uridine kinase